MMIYCCLFAFIVDNINDVTKTTKWRQKTLAEYCKYSQI